MTTIYFTPTSCGAATFISAKGAGVEFKEANVVSLADHTLVKNGEDYKKINPKGNVPALVLEDGTLLNENVGTLYWVGKNGKNVLGKDAVEETLVVNTLGYLASEVHQSFGPLFYYKGDDEGKKPLVEKLLKKLEYLEANYFDEDKKFLVGDAFTVADAYLYIMLHWPAYVSVDISKFANLEAYKKRVAAIDFVKEAHAEMEKLKNEQEASK